MFGAVILLNKPIGISSFSALGPLKRELGTKKIGHTGTLDPFAQGLLVVLCGYATKLADLFSGCDKRYIAEVRFGVETDTLDPEGVTIDTGPIPTEPEVIEATRRHTGDMQQIPPRFSAIKIDGKRAYKSARKGEAIEMPSREVSVFSNELIGYDPPAARISVHCSKGTYIRSLARDMGRSCGTCAYVQKLCRTSVGGFRLDEIPEGERWLSLTPAEALARTSVPILTADETTSRRIRFGKPIDRASVSPSPEADGVYAVVSETRELLALVSGSGADDRLTYRMVVPQEIGSGV